MGDSERTLTVGKSFVSTHKPLKFKRSSDHRHKVPNRPSIKGFQKLNVKWITPPLPPKPPDGTAVNRGRGLHCVVEERNMAKKSLKSLVTSTSSLASVNSNTNNELKPIPWEPPIQNDNNGQVKFYKDK